MSTLVTLALALFVVLDLEIIVANVLAGDREAIQRWRVGTSRGDELLARFVVMGCGVLNMPKLPGIAGINSFKGKIFHTARWDYDYTGGEWRNPALTKLADKKVAIIGTGATALCLGEHRVRGAHTGGGAQVDAEVASFGHRLPPQ